MDEEDENNLTDEENKVRRRINKQQKQQQGKGKKEKKEKPCRTRFDVLATPHKRAILGTYRDHSYHFPKDKVERLKHKLQELYAMTPEETEKYFEQLRKETNDIAKQKMMKIMLKKLYGKQLKEKQEKQAYMFIEKLLKRGMLHAFNNPVPPLISIRLRNLSDIILEQVCDLRNVDIPDRDKADQTGSFLIAVADWIAIAIEHIYYAVQLKKNQELEQIEKEAAEQQDTGKGDGKIKKDEKKKDKPASDKDKVEGDEIDEGDEIFSDIEME